MAESCPTLGVLHYEARQFHRTVGDDDTLNHLRFRRSGTRRLRIASAWMVFLLQDRRWQAVGQTVHRGNDA
jgi:hypothetical protein